MSLARDAVANARIRGWRRVIRAFLFRSTLVANVTNQSRLCRNGHKAKRGITERTMIATTIFLIAFFTRALGHFRGSAGQGVCFLDAL